MAAIFLHGNVTVQPGYSPTKYPNLAMANVDTVNGDQYCAAAFVIGVDPLANSVSAKSGCNGQGGSGDTSCVSLTLAGGCDAPGPDPDSPDRCRKGTV